MTIDFTNENKTLYVSLNGRLDSKTTSDLENFFKKELTDETTSLTLNFANVDYISSKGLRILIAVYKTMKPRPMTIVNINTSVKEILRISGLLELFNLV